MNSLLLYTFIQKEKEIKINQLKLVKLSILSKFCVSKVQRSVDGGQ